MALAVDSQMSGGNGVTSSTSPWTWSFTNTAGTVIYLFLTIDGATHPTVTVTYGGTSLTQLGSVFNTGGNPGNIFLFRLTSPATGANNFVVTWNTGTQVAIGCAISFTGNAATPDSGTASTNAYLGTASTAVSLTIPSTSTGNICIEGTSYGDATASYSPSGTLSSKLEVNSTSFSNNEAIQFQNSSASSTNTTMTLTTSTSWFAIGIQVLAAAGATVDQTMAAMNKPTNTPMFQPIGTVVY